MAVRHLAVCLFVCVAVFTFFTTASAQTTEWAVCASEGGACAFSGTQEVRYGANGSYVYQTMSDGAFCANSVFGDPAYGTVKECAIRNATSTGQWTFCASEGGMCTFSGTQQVRYGANGAYVYQTLSDGVFCSNSVFGDPAM